MKTVNKCVGCGRETKCMATLSKNNEWLFKKKEVPMCIDCFCCLLDHKYYTHSEDDTGYLKLDDELVKQIMENDVNGIEFDE